MPHRHDSASCSHRRGHATREVPCSQQDLATMLSTVTSVQDLVSGLAFSLLVLVKFFFTIHLEVNMETNLFTVFEAVKSECASLHGG
jgi:hypothetical protein